MDKIDVILLMSVNLCFAASRSSTALDKLRQCAS